MHFLNKAFILASLCVASASAAATTRAESSGALTLVSGPVSDASCICAGNICACADTVDADTVEPVGMTLVSGPVADGGCLCAGNICACAD